MGVVKIYIFISLIILIVLLLIGVPVPFAFIGSIIYLIFTLDYAHSFLLPYGFSEMSTSVLLAIPLFIMAGGILDKGNTADALVDLVDVFVGKIKGGLGAVTVVSSAVFGSITGSATATLSAMGAIMFPRMERNGYAKGHSAALLASSSVLGMLIPPSTIMILYAWVGNQSVLATFLATIVPGVILIILLCLVNLYLVKKQDATVIQSEQTIECEKIIKRKKPIELSFFKKFKTRGLKALPALTLPLLVLGGIYGGIMTPTESAAVAVVYATILGFLVYKGLSIKELIKLLIDTATTTGVIMVMLYAIMMLSRIYIMEDLPTKIMDFLTSISNSTFVLLLMINLFMIIIGMLMDDVSAVLLSTPVLLPLVVMLDVSPIHFAAILAVNLGMGNITPPTAPLLFLSGRISGAPINEMMRPTIIMIVFAWLPTLLLTTFIPELSLFLPNLLLGN